MIYTQIDRQNANLRKRALYFKLMKSNKETIGIFATLVEMVLQTRVSPLSQQLHRIESVMSELEVLKSHLHPSDQFLYFLIDKECYQIRSKIMSQQLKSQSAALFIHIIFTLFDKDSSTTETAQIWKMKLHRKEISSLLATDCIKELIHLVGHVTQQLISQYNFSEMTRNKDANKKYVIDFKVQLGNSPDLGNELRTEQFKLKSCSARLNQAFEMTIDCYWREKINLPIFKVSTYVGNQYRKGRKTSQETRVDSCSSRSSKELNLIKCRSIQEKEQAILIYDSQLGLTILSSSDSDSFSHSRNNIEEGDLKDDGDQFQLLIEEGVNDDEIFAIENEINFRNWQKFLEVNFH